MSDDWVLTISYQAQCDLFVFPWDPDVERGGVVMGRWENARIASTDTGRDLFVRRVFPADRDCTPDSVRIDYTAKVGLETFEVPSLSGRPGGLYGAADAGRICGSIHSHPDGVLREISRPDLRNASENAAALTIPAGRPWLSVIATAREAWSEGYLVDTWDDPNLDFRLVFSDERVALPTVILQSEVEWEVEEGQRALAHTNEGNN